MKKIISLTLCFAIATSMCVPAFAAEGNFPDLPPGVVLYEGEIWIPANEENGDGIMLLEDANSECGKTGHLPPNTYRYVGYKKGDARVDAAIATLEGFLVSLIIPGNEFPFLVGLIGVGIAFNPSDITGDYVVYIWSNGVHSWEHVVGYATVNNKRIYLACEVKTS